MCHRVGMSELVAKSSIKSGMWDYFGLKRRADGKAVNDGSMTCQACRKQVLPKHRNTSNRLVHLKTSHTSIYVEAKSAMDAKGKRPAWEYITIKLQMALSNVPQVLHNKREQLLQQIKTFTICCRHLVTSCY